MKKKIGIFLVYLSVAGRNEEKKNVYLCFWVFFQ